MENANKLAKETFKMLKQLTKEVGAFALRSWSYEEKISLQCDEDMLLDFLDKNGLYFNAKDGDGTPAYENDSLFLFYAPKKEEF